MNQPLKLIPSVVIDDQTSSLSDQIRGAAAICVAAVHAVQVFLLPYFGLGGALHLATSLLATYAVLAFFIVSGFMISVSVSRHTRDGDFIWVDFLFARITRIYPPLLTAIVVSVLSYLTIRAFGLHGSESFRLGGELFVVREKAELSWSTLLATLFLSYGVFPHSPTVILMNGPLWTLCYEFWFYILAMFAVNTVSKRHLSGTVPLMLLLVTIAIGGSWLLLMFLIVWCAGYTLGVAYLGGNLSRERAQHVLIATLTAALVSIAIAGGADIQALLIEPFASKRSQFILAMVGVIFTVALAFLIRARPRYKSSFLRNSSRYSYTLYVIHFPLYILLFSILHPLTHALDWRFSLLVTLGAIIVSTCMAAILSRFVEDTVVLRRRAGIPARHS